MPTFWYKKKYPDVAKSYGKALDMTIKGTGWIIKGINENFFASTLGSLGNPASPMVYVTSEESAFTLLMILNWAYLFQRARRRLSSR